MGGSSKSSSDTSSTTNTTNRTTSNVTNKNISDVNDAQVFSEVSGGVEITTTDFDAVDQAFNFGGDALTGILDFGSEVIGNQQIQLSDSLKSINAAAGSNAKLNDELQENTKKVALAVGGVGLLVFLFLRGTK